MYDREIQNRTLTFAVSGMLWNRSLVMIDSETRSLWSHLLGESMQGELKGTLLKTLPCDLLTWNAWRREHPETTMLDLQQTAAVFNKTIYRRPQRFTFGWLADDGQPYHVTLNKMRRNPLQNLTLGRSQLLLTYDAPSTAARLFSRNVKGRTLTFIADKPGLMKDTNTGSLWSRTSGSAVEGALKGQRLKQLVGIMSFIRAWNAFHPKSRGV